MKNKIYLNDELIEDVKSLRQYRITLNGNNNELKLNEFEGNALVYISIDGDNCKFQIGINNIIKNDLSINYWNTADQIVNGSEIYIGNNNFFNGSNIVLIAPLNTKLSIGNGNLFAGSITFWARNDHIIYDRRTKKRLNNDSDISIGDNNWIAQNVSFLPGGNIKSNSVVAYGSLVNKEINKSNVLLAGVPIKIKHKNIDWSRASKQENIDYENNIEIKNNRK